jgi:hypothetical protein
MQSSWKRAHQGVGEAHHGEPGPVGVGVLQSADVVFDMGVGPHVHVEVDGVAGGVGVVTPVAEQRRRKQGLLGAGVQWFAAHDQPGFFAVAPVAAVAAALVAWSVPTSRDPSAHKTGGPGLVLSSAAIALLTYIVPEA